MQQMTPDASIPANTVASFTKEANVWASALRSGFGSLRNRAASGMRSLPPITKMMGQFQTSANRAMSPALNAVERGVGQMATRALGPEKGQVAARVFRGVPKTMAHSAVNDALWGAGISGALGAVTAEKGERGSGFLQGAGQGAYSGGLSGALSGLGKGLVRNTGNMHLSSLSKQHNIPRPELAKQVKGMSLWDAAKQTQASGQNPLQKQLAYNRLGKAAIPVAEMALPLTLMSSDKQEAPAPQMPPMAPNTPSVYAQPQYYKAAAETRLRPIDFTKIPAYHR